MSEEKKPVFCVVQEVQIPGIPGASGATFFPEVSRTGIISWTNTHGYENPKPIDIASTIVELTAQNVADSTNAKVAAELAQGKAEVAQGKAETAQRTTESKLATFDTVTLPAAVAAVKSQETSSIGAVSAQQTTSVNAVKAQQTASTNAVKSQETTSVGVVKAKETASVAVVKAQEDASVAEVARVGDAKIALATTQANNAAASASAASTSEANAKSSEAKASASEIKAKASETNAASSERNARIASEGSDFDAMSIGLTHSAKGWAMQAAGGQVNADWRTNDSSSKSYIFGKELVVEKVDMVEVTNEEIDAMEL